MASVVRSIARLTPRLVLLALFLASTPTPAARTAKSDAADPAVAQSYYPEVRLRKLHLVRPDLIPYPIAYEVYC
jgi:hypothetical protein